MTDAAPLVSALIPAYNRERFIVEAITSVLAQTYQPLECVVVDDGSTDGTDRIVSSFGARLRHVRQSNRGPAAARNEGARVARGDFLAFLDADDIWEPTKIERQMELFRARPELGLVYCSLQVIDAQGRHLHFLPSADPAVALRNVLLNESPSIGIGSTGLVRRCSFLAAGGFDERLMGPEDSDLTWRLAAQFPIASVPEPLARYRQHAAQIHRDISRWEHEWNLVLGKAFKSRLLPPEIQALQRRARTNLALTAAYNQRGNHVRYVAKICRAFWLSPSRTTGWIARSGLRRLGHLSAGLR